MRFVLLALALIAESLPPALGRIVQTERAFARASVTHGQRDAFIAYLADDGITFSPNPGRGPEGIRKRPPAPSSSVLNWAPMLGAVSRSGDLGFTTGPYIVTDPSGSRPPRHGMYLTVWRRHPDGRYLVDLDAGITTRTAVAPIQGLAFSPVSGPGAEAPASPGPGNALQDADARYNRKVERHEWPAAAAQFHRPDARLHVEGRGPLTTREDVSEWLSRRRETRFTTAGHRWSADEDFGYTYGRYNMDRTRGWYVRLWTREPDADWRVLIETFLPLAAA